MNEVRFFVSSPTGPAPGGSKSAFPIYKRKGMAQMTATYPGFKPSMFKPCPSCGFTGRVAVSDAGGAKTTLWRQTVAEAGLQAMKEADLAPFSCALEVELIFHLPRPKSHFIGGNVTRLRTGMPMFPAVRPDCLKLARSTEDALTGKCWDDDAQIVKETIEKIYSEQSGCWIIIREAGK